MLRPSIEEFCEWAKSNSNMSRIRNSLSTYPDLVEIKDHVSYDSSDITIFLFDVYKIFDVILIDLVDNLRS